MEYLRAPWRLFSLLADTPKVQLAGYETPTFILIASFLIIVLFLASSAQLIVQCNQLARELQDAAKALDALEKSAKLDEVRSLFDSSFATSTMWTRIEETLVQPSENSAYFTTESLDQLVSKDHLIEEGVNISYFNALPGILTGVGLLMTFIAILEGLSHVSVTSTMDVKGIGGLINGLSGKFVSSIAAVSCAVMFVFVEKFAYAKPVSGYRHVLKALQQRFNRRTTEQLLVELRAELSAQSLLIHKALGISSEQEKKLSPLQAERASLNDARHPSSLEGHA
jgi:hypothetical protein